jgi:hypothetical protein
VLSALAAAALLAGLLPAIGLDPGALMRPATAAAGSSGVLALLGAHHELAQLSHDTRLATWGGPAPAAHGEKRLWSVGFTLDSAEDPTAEAGTVEREAALDLRRACTALHAASADLGTRPPAHVRAQLDAADAILDEAAARLAAAQGVR